MIQVFNVAYCNSQNIDFRHFSIWRKRWQELAQSAQRDVKRSDSRAFSFGVSCPVFDRLSASLFSCHAWLRLVQRLVFVVFVAAFFTMFFRYAVIAGYFCRPCGEHHVSAAFVAHGMYDF